MDIQSRKLNFVQDFLRLTNEELIIKFENLLTNERMKNYESELTPMSMEQFNKMIDKAEKDSANNRLTSINTLNKEIDSWV